MKKQLITLMGLISTGVSANTVTDVGVGALPGRTPQNGLDWEMHSYCVDINDNGQAACRTVALGPERRCFSYGTSKCRDTVSRTHLWDGVELVDVSGPDHENDEPLVINGLGEIAGGTRVADPAPDGRLKTRATIWRAGQAPELLDTDRMVLDLNDQGDMILVGGRSPLVRGKHGFFSNDTRFHAEDTQLRRTDGGNGDFGGLKSVPVLINDAGDVVGKQLLQAHVDAFASATGDEVPEVSGIGWMLDNATVDALPLNEVGELDTKGWKLFPAPYVRPKAQREFAIVDHSFAMLGDLDELGNFTLTQARDTYAATNHLKYRGFHCSRTTHRVGTSTLPFGCDALPNPSDYYSNNYALGTNNLGDVVGFAVQPTGSHRPDAWIPMVWLRDRHNRLVPFPADELLPADSGLSVHEVNAINNLREVAATCKNAAGALHGCIITIDTPAIPARLKKPMVEILSPASGDVSGTVTVSADAFDRDGWIEKVVFKIDTTFIGKATSAPFRIEWDSSSVTPGRHVLKAFATDNDGRSKMGKVTLNVVAANNPPTTPPATGGGDSVVEGSGTISALGAGFIVVSDGNRLYYDGNTAIAFNDVGGFAIGLPVQYKATHDANGRLIASDLEVN